MIKTKIPTFLGLILIISGITAGLLLIQNRQLFKLQASEESAPKNVRVTNITDDSFTVVWTTENLSRGFIKWWKSGNIVKNTANEIGKDQSYVHQAQVSGLLPNSSYYFKINSNTFDYDNNNLDWVVKTGQNLPPPSSPITISGTVLNPEKLPVRNAVVFATIGGSSLYSTSVSENGSFILSVEGIRSKDLSNYIEIDNDKSLIELSVQAGPLGVASAQIYPKSAQSMPSIILGQIHDFRNLMNYNIQEVPSAEILFP